jgi:acetylornithine deacetylase/succinyl-diaminopimelate desuccinylase-like protein
VDNLALSSYLAASKDRILATLVEWLQIPSVSADPAHATSVARSAAYFAGLLRDAGLDNVEVLPTGCPEAPQGNGPGAAKGCTAKGSAGGPAVYGEWLRAGPSAPTVLVYGHHDVQPADPVEEWSSAPFEPAIVGDELRARGASDDKGQMVMQVEAARGLLCELGRLPVNLKFLVEGEEEVGSPHFEDLLVHEARRFAADVVVVSDTTMLAPDLPSVTVGMRGLVAFDVTVRTAKADLHSGIWGGTVPNAALLAARLAAGLHDERGRVTLPGFYDRVTELSEAEQASLRAVPFDQELFCSQAGVAYLEGEEGRSPFERTGTRPTAEVVGIHSGYGGPGIKTIVPATANLKVAVRLVPDQRPEEVAAAFETWLAERAPAGAELSVARHGGVAPLLTPVDHPAMRALSEAVRRVWGKGPLFTRDGGSGPEEALGRVLGAPVLALGVALPTDNFHAPNEHLQLAQLWRGVLAAGELLVELGAPKDLV